MRNEFFDASAPRNDYHSSVASSTPLIPAPSGRGRPKGSSSLKSSKKSSKASTSFSIAASTIDSDSKKSQSFADNQSAIADSQMNLLNTVDEQVSNLDTNLLKWQIEVIGKSRSLTRMNLHYRFSFFYRQVKKIRFGYVRHVAA